MDEWVGVRSMERCKGWLEVSLGEEELVKEDSRTSKSLERKAKSKVSKTRPPRFGR